jgi:hypothetical protein
MGTMRHYLFAGLRIASEIPLPEWVAFEDPSPAGEPQACISIEEQPIEEKQGAETPAGDDPGSVTTREYRSFVPGLGCFRVLDGRRILVAPLEGANPQQFRPWLTGSAWAALCYQRGMFLIHASGVMAGDSAVLFCARTKGGKSTMAAQMHARGHALVSDDLCNLDIPGVGTPVVFPSTPRFKLWKDALGEIGWNTESLEPDRARAGKFHALRTTNSLPGRAPLRAIYLLTWGEFGLRRLSGLSGLRNFLSASTYRAKLVEGTGHLGRHTNQSLELLQRVPLWELRRPRDLEALGRSATLLAEHLLSYD